MKKLSSILLIFVLATQAYAVDTVIKSNKIKFGLPATGDKTIEFNLGLGSLNPKLRWGDTNSQFEFANDGSNYLGLGSGSGSGASGINLLSGKNSDFETGTGQWTSSGGTFTSNVSTPLNGKASGSWTPSATSQTLTSASATITEGLKGGSCSATIFYKTSEATNFYTLQVLDGSSVVRASVQLPSPVTAASTSPAIYFPCPTSGTLSLQVVSSGSASALAIDDAFLGSTPTVQISQATLFGGVDYPINGSQNFVGNTVGSLGALSPAISVSGTTLYNKATAAVTSEVGVTFAGGLPVGEYQLTAAGSFTAEASAGAAQCDYEFTDGTNQLGGGYVIIGYNAASFNSVGATSMVGQMHVTSPIAGPATIYIRARKFSGTDCRIYTDQNALSIRLYRFPTQSEQAVRADTINWLADAMWYSSSGSNTNLSITPGSWAVPSNANGELIVNSNSTTLQVPCSGTNPSTSATSCAAGTPEAGFVFNLPAAQAVQVCADFAHYATGTGLIDHDFKLIETPNTSDTAVSSGGTAVIASILSNVSAGMSHPTHLCENFNFSSAGQKTIRLSAQDEFSSGTVSTNQILTEGASVLGRGIHFTARPLTQSVPAPILVGGTPTYQVFTSGSGTYVPTAGTRQIEVRMVAGGGGGGGGGGAGSSSGGNGGSTTFGSSLLSCSGGQSGANAGTNKAPLGGSCTVSSPAVQITAVQGGAGTGWLPNSASTTPIGPSGGVSAFGGNGGGSSNGIGGIDAAPNSGAGGGGGQGANANSAGGAGAAGGYLEAVIPSGSLSGSYSYSIASGGTAGSAGTGGGAGTAGGSGIIIVKEFK